MGNFFFTNILEFLKDIDLSYPIFIDDFTLMQPFPNEKSRLSDPIKPFTSTVSILLSKLNPVNSSKLDSTDIQYFLSYLLFIRCGVFS